ncbi:MAG TPA: alkene reductase [Pyrinomonadaceae bacterium]|nr:alkene reductase [Pyrinomonadaceae bacterium]
MANLFDPIKVGDLELKHRIVMSPLTRSRAGENLAPREMNVEYYTQRSSAALIISEATHVFPQGIGYPFTPGIGTEEQIAGWKKVVDSVHAAGGKIFLQLWHVGRISHRVMQENNDLPVSASAIKPAGELFTGKGMMEFETPRALDLEEIPGIVEYFRTGAENAKKAGFDGVEIHGANGYLLDQFLEDGTNKRTDEYGGAIENRARLLLEVVDEAIKIWGANRVGVRLSPAGSFSDMSDSNQSETFGYVAEKLGERKIAYLHVIEPEPSNAVKYTVNGEQISAVKHLKSIFKGTVIAAQGYDLASGNAVVESGDADLVAFGKLFIANPDLPERFLQNAPLNPPVESAFYGGGEHGYTDYPTLEKAKSANAKN